MIYSFNRFVIAWTRQIDGSEFTRRLSITAIHAAIFFFSVFSAFLLRFEFKLPPDEFRHLGLGIAVALSVKFVVFHVAGLNRGWWRFVSLPDVVRLAIANTVSSAIMFGAVSLLTAGFPRSVFIVDLLICVIGTVGVRVAVRVIMEAGIQINQTSPDKRVLIYGAGIAGQMLLREIRSNSQLVYTVCGFVDDDRQKSGVSIQGVPVLGTGAALASIIANSRAGEVLIAIPSAAGAQVTAILNRCHGAKIACKTIPGWGELVEGGLTRQIRDVAVEDLLGRMPVRLDQGRIRAKISCRVVLVTGAAGSIGSELCRQIARFRPAAIVGYEIAETPLFHLQREMAREFPEVAFHPEIGSVQNPMRLDEVFEKHRPAIVYHAAAYKHVPMMESHIFEAIENNVFGAWHVATAAALHHAEDFVMISSDKAVRPANVMGATKRLAELVVRSMQNGGGIFVSVRFGNVLGSNGSVVPIFKEQIASGGPVTVTHPEMRRYFMTIPEACQLVLQASTMGRGGEIFTLDMGEPVRIVDLARNLILLSGLRPEEDIKIEYVGIRPGEKLYEELSAFEEDVIPTSHEKIRIFAGATIPWPSIQARLTRMQAVCQARELNELILILKEMLPEYNPSTDLLRRVLKPLAAQAGQQFQ